MPTVRAARPNSRVLILEDHLLFAESLELALNLEGYAARRLPLPASPTGTGQLLTTALRMGPRVVLLDLDLGPFGDGVRLIHPLALSGANVVVVTASPDRYRWGECMRHGARKTMSKTQPLNEILGVVRRIHDGLPVVGARERDELIRGWHEHRKGVQDERQRLESLTPRESEVLAKLMAGMPVRDIARDSVVSVATVRTQVKSILSKLAVSSQLAAVGMAHHAGWHPAVRMALSTPPGAPGRP
ncbi:response regulator transcription factor [Nocardioides sp. cx-169]|uniref:LuxR C-terminal-related transcriptional regulator n=1 Tax=Nocardioides sp. cx-169 TaxID=2899080 RepID=UPI001E378E8D|nr:response regulator transcription factor [Nocardioides sp. cx-169]MCD4536325.1 response regulator transcription factor [Nocardioides sp. cx-169]